MGGRQEESFAQQFAFWLADWCVLMAFWIGLNGDFSKADLGIGAAAALLGSFMSLAAESQNVVRFAPHWRYIWAARGSIWQIVTGTFTVLGMLFTGRGTAGGETAYAAFDPGGDDPSNQARRAVAETFPTFSATSIMIGVDRKARRIIFHLLGTKSTPPTVRRLREPQQ